MCGTRPVGSARVCQVLRELIRLGRDCGSRLGGHCDIVGSPSLHQEQSNCENNPDRNSPPFPSAGPIERTISGKFANSQHRYLPSNRDGDCYAKTSDTARVSVWGIAKPERNHEKGWPCCQRRYEVSTRSGRARRTSGVPRSADRWTNNSRWSRQVNEPS